MKRVSQKDLQKMYEAPSPDMEERIHQVIASLPVQVQEGKVMKKKWFLSAVLALAAILAVGAIGLAATGIYGNRVVDLNGNVTEEEGYTDVQIQEHQAEWSYLEKLLETVPDGDLGIVLDQNHEARADRWLRTVNTQEEFDNAMAGVDYLMVPNRFPDNMELEKAEIYLLGREGVEYHLAEEHTEGQYTVQRYTVDEADTFIYGYRLVYSDPLNPDRKAGVTANLGGVGNMGIAISEGDTAELISIPGMDKALLLHLDEWDLWQIETMRAMDTTIIYGDYPEKESDVANRTLTEEWYMIEGLFVSPDTLKDMIQAGE